MKNKIHLSILLTSIICVLAPIAHCGSLPNTKWNPEVNGIKLGSSFKQVISIFKKPNTQEENSKITTLKYEGLTIEINKKSSKVSSIEVFSPEWDIKPKIKVKMTKKEAYKILGKPLHFEERDNQIYVWWWHANPEIDSLFLVVFDKQKIVRVVLAEDHSI